MRKIFGALFAIIPILAIIVIFISPNQRKTKSQPIEPKPITSQTTTTPIKSDVKTVSNPHAKGYQAILKQKGFYSSDPRNQKTIATNAMIQYEGYDFEEVEQTEGGVSAITCFYWDKSLAYQYGVRKNASGLMELYTLQILYMDGATGKIKQTEILK